MIISKTPLSICLFGAETDNKDWYLKNTGISVGFSINKYVYVSAIKKNKPVINNLYIEKTIKYLEKIGISCKNVEINFFYDLENKILNFEHCLIIGTIKCILSINEKFYSNKKISNICNDILECNNLSGSFFSCFGGINCLRFSKNNEISINPIKLNNESLNILSKNLNIYNLKNQNLSKYSFNDKEIWSILKITEDSINHFLNFNIVELSNLINKNFNIKKTKISNEFVNKCIFSKINFFDIANDLSCGIIVENDCFKFSNEFEQIKYDFDFNGSQIVLCE